MCTSTTASCMWHAHNTQSTHTKRMCHHHKGPRSRQQNQQHHHHLHQQSSPTRTITNMSVCTLCTPKYIKFVTKIPKSTVELTRTSTHMYLRMNECHAARMHAAALRQCMSLWWHHDYWYLAKRIRNATGTGWGR